MSFEPPIPTPHNQHLLIDIDGTLIDETYSLTSEAIFNSIEELQECGWTIHLSSDSSIELMTHWASTLGINGSLVAEKGSVLHHDGEVILDQAHYDSFREIRQDIVSRIQAQHPGCSIWEGEPVQELLGQPTHASPGEHVVLINAYRRCSFGLFVRSVDNDGKYVMSEDMCAQILDTAREALPEDLDIDDNPEYGLLILANQQANKRAGTLRLMDILGLVEVGMVGNSITDFIGNDIARHYAVSNTTPEFRTVADYTSDQSVTKGVVDIIRRLTAASVQEHPPSTHPR